MIRTGGAVPSDERSLRIERARELRQLSTNAEALLWSRLRTREVDGLKFRRQHPIGTFFLDFYCRERHLCIELDGRQHGTPDQRAYDEERTVFLEAAGIQVLRFGNQQVIDDIEGVLAVIGEAAESRRGFKRPS